MSGKPWDVRPCFSVLGPLSPQPGLPHIRAQVLFLGAEVGSEGWRALRRAQSLAQLHSFTQALSLSTIWRMFLVGATVEAQAFCLPGSNSLLVLCQGSQGVLRGHPGALVVKLGPIWAGWPEAKGPAKSPAQGLIMISAVVNLGCA